MSINVFSLHAIPINISLVHKESVNFKFADSRPNPISAQSSLDEYVDILQVQQLLLENSNSNSNSAASSSPCTTATSTVPTNTSYSSSVMTPTPSSSVVAAASKNRPRVNLQKAAEYSCQVQGKICIMEIGRDA